MASDRCSFIFTQHPLLQLHTKDTMFENSKSDNVRELADRKLNFGPWNTTLCFSLKPALLLLFLCSLCMWTFSVHHHLVGKRCITSRCHCSAFSNLFPHKFVPNLRDLEVSTLCFWIMSFMTERPQEVRIRNYTSSPQILSIQSVLCSTPSTTMTAELLTIIEKFGPDPVVVVVVDYRWERQKSCYTPLRIYGTPVERVSIFTLVNKARSACTASNGWERSSVAVIVPDED